MSEVPIEWRKKILSAQIRESVSLARMHEARTFLLELQQLEPDNQEISDELSRLERKVRLKIATNNSDNPYQCKLSADKGHSESKPKVQKAKKSTTASFDNSGRVLTQAIKYKDPTSKIAPASKKLSEEEQARSDVNKLITRYKSETELEKKLSKNKMRKHQRFLDTCVKDAPYLWSITERDGIAHIQDRLAKEFRRRYREKTLIISISSAIILLIFTILCSCMLLNAAKHADIKIQQALVNENREEVLYELDSADRPLYFLLYPQLKKSMEQAHIWLGKLDQIQELIDAIEVGTRDLRSLTSDEYKSIKFLEEARDEKSIKLIARLNRVKKEKLSQEEQARVQLLKEIAKGVPAESPFSANLKEDEQRLQKEEEELTAALNHFKETQSIHGKNEKHMSKHYQRLKDIKNLRRSIILMQDNIAQLPHCKYYSDHLDILIKLNSNIYPPAQELAALAEHLPTLDEINKIMRYTAGNTDSETLQKAEQIILKDAPTFSSENPATVTQVGIMEEVFTTRAFQQPIYQVISAIDGKVWLTDNKPTQDKKGNTLLTRSALDPIAQGSTDNKITITQQTGLSLKYFNVTELIKLCKLTKSEFFINTKVLDTLTKVIQYQNDSCPALAKAYIYQQLFTMIEEHPSPALMGLSFSELLRNDIKSFKETLKLYKIKLTSQNWLVINSSNHQAEQVFADWFYKNRFHNYSNDCKKTLRNILFSEVLYAGYVNGDNKAMYQSDLKPDTQIWYLDKESKKLNMGTLKDIPQAIPYSPLLYSSKQ